MMWVYVHFGRDRENECKGRLKREEEVGCMDDYVDGKRGYKRRSESLEDEKMWQLGEG